MGLQQVSHGRKPGDVGMGAWRHGGMEAAWRCNGDAAWLACFTHKSAKMSKAGQS